LFVKEIYHERICPLRNGMKKSSAISHVFVMKK